MRWATRRGCHVDRAACAWLIRRFIDPNAAFVFVDDPSDVPDDAPAAPGLDAICRDLTYVADDDRVLEISAVIFDGLYEHHHRT